MKLGTIAYSAVAVAALTSQAFAQNKTNPGPGITLLEYSGRALAVADLCAPGVSMRATKYAERKATPQAWGSRADVNATIAANADFFDFPGWSLVIGRARGAGEDWPADKQNLEKRWYWNFGPRAGGVVKAETPIAQGMTEVVGAHYVIYENGKKLPYPTDDPTIIGAHRRTAYAIDKSHEHFLVFVSDVSITCGTVVDRLLADAKDAGINDIEIITNEDGGGSSQLYVKGRGQVITSGRQVNNHIGIVAKGSGPAPHCPNRKPAGIFEAASCESISGWATDIDAQPKGSTVKLTYGGTLGTPGVIEQTFQAETPGQCAPFGPCNYTFNEPPTDQIFDGVQREVHAYVLDTEGGPSGELLNSPRIIKCDPKPAAQAPQPTADAGPSAAPADQSLLPIDGDEGCSIGRARTSNALWAAFVGLVVLGARTLRRRR